MTIAAAEADDERDNENASNHTHRDQQSLDVHCKPNSNKHTTDTPINAIYQSGSVV